MKFPEFEKALEELIERYQKESDESVTEIHVETIWTNGDQEIFLDILIEDGE